MTYSPPSNTLPGMNGSASAGSSASYARGDHVHPSDTTRVPILPVVALSYSTTINTNGAQGNYFTVTLTGATALLANPTNLVPGRSYTWQITQDTTGSRLLTYGTMFQWSKKTLPVLTTTGGGVDLITAFYNGTYLLATSMNNYGAKAIYTPVDSTYALVFDDEFNGTSIDNTKWAVLNGQTLNNVVVSSANATVSNGVANIALTGTTSSQTGAFMTTNGQISFSASNGAVYMEARIKMPTTPGEGLWPAFWTNNNGGFPEIDIFEWIGVKNSQQSQTYHNPSDGSAPPTGTTGYGFQIFANPGLGDLSAAYHVYGLLWTTSSLTWFIDGVQTYTITNGQSISGYWSGGAATVNITGGPQMINLQIGSNGFGGQNNTIDASTVLPAIMKVDYVHVYQVNGTAVTPQTGYGGPGNSVGSGN